MLPWASSLTADSAALASRNATATPLIVSSPYAGRMTEPFTIEPNKELPTDDLGQQVLAYAVGSMNATGSRMVVVGNANFLTDEIVGRDAGNLAFGLGGSRGLHRMSRLHQSRSRAANGARSCSVAQLNSRLWPMAT